MPECLATAYLDGALWSQAEEVKRWEEERKRRPFSLNQVGCMRIVAHNSSRDVCAAVKDSEVICQGCMSHVDLDY